MFNSGQTLQPYEKLEQELGIWCGRPGKTIVCNSGTAALHLALEALQLPQGSEVIMPNYTMISCARAVTLAGLVPVFVGCDPNTYCMDPINVKIAVNGSTECRAILAVHVYGRICDMDAINQIADDNDLKVIEDLAEAHSVIPHKDTDVACWSFYKNKVVYGEEGGACAFKYPEHAGLAAQLRSVGFTVAHDYTHIPRGHNYRLANCLAQQISSSLHKINDNLRKRRQIEAYYKAHTPEAWLNIISRAVPWVYDIRIPGLTEDQQYEIIMVLNMSNIKARHGFKPMKMQAEYCKHWYYGEARLEETLAREVIYLPIEPGVSHPGSAELALGIIKDVVW